MDIKTPSDWLRFARENLGEPGAEPLVFVSYNLADRELVERALPFVETELGHLKCPETGAPYRLEHFGSTSYGTKQGELFDERIAKWMWSCRGAIFIWSQKFVHEHGWCRRLEIPSLVWRWKRQALPLFILRAGPTSDVTLNIPVKIDGEEEFTAKLALLTDDRNPAANAPGHEGKFLRDLDGTAFDLRMVNVSQSYAKAIAERWAGSKSLPVASASPRASTETAFRVKWSGDFSSEQSSSSVLGRQEEYAELTGHTCDRDVGVVMVSALGGQGKTALVRAWIERSSRTVLRNNFEGCFAFSFDHGHGQDEFAKELAAFLSPGSPSLGANDLTPWDLVEGLRKRRVLLFLDGMEVIQVEEKQSEREGRVEQGPVLDLLFGLCQEAKECQSVAVVTSRLHLLGFEDYESSSLRTLDLEGLSDEAGGELLGNLGVRQPSDRRKGYSRDLAGHPLLLRVFANAVRRRVGSLSFGNAAEKIAEEMRIAEPGEFKDKLRRVITSYRKELAPLEQAIITAVGVFGGSSTLEHIRSYMQQRDQAHSALEAHLIAAPLRELTEAGILTLREEGARRLYSCHPILREGFAPDSAEVRLAARISLYSRPAPIRPHSLAEAEPYLRAIRIYAKAGDFKEASAILAEHLNFGDVFDEFYDGPRALLDCLKEFLGPKRRDECQQMLGRGFMTAMIPRLMMAAIALDEWEEAAQYSEWDKNLLESEGQKADALSVGLRAQIAAEIGEAEDAKSLYRRAIDIASPEQRGHYVLALAELERHLGATQSALKGVGRWLSEEYPVSSWISGWGEALHVLEGALARCQPDVAARCHQARAALMRAARTRAPTLEKYIEYDKLSLKQRATRTQDDWRNQLKLADELAAMANDFGARAQGSWPIARAEALNALGRASEAEAVASVAAKQFPARSWRRRWFDVEMARAHFLQGKIDKGAEEACQIMRSSYVRQRELTARDAAELILEFAARISDRAIVSEAQRSLERVASRQRVMDADIPYLGPLPGEAGWEARVAQYLLQQVRKGLGEGLPTREELNSAMVLAAEIGSDEAILELRRIGASTQSEDAQGVSALAAAAKGGHERALEALLKRPEAYDIEHAQDLAAAIEALRADQIGALKLLLRAHGTGAPIALNALLATAAEVGSGEAVEELCKSGADPRALHNELHPVVRAARSGNLDAVAALVNLIGNINEAIDQDGESALMAASGAGREVVVSWLVDHGADIDARDRSGRTAAEYAIERGGAGILDVLRAMTRRDALAEIEPAVLAVSGATGGHVGILKHALARGAGMNEADRRGWTPLLAAAFNGHLDVIHAIRELAPELSIDAQSPRGWTALMGAAEAGRSNVVKMLRTDLGASLDIVDASGWDALGHALSMGRTDVIHLLVSFGAKLRDDDATLRVVALAATRQHREALAAFLTAMKQVGLLERLGAAILPTSESLPADPDSAAEVFIAHVSLGTGKSHVIPTRSLEGLSEEELASQPCVYLTGGAASYAGLLLSPAPTALIELFLSQKVSSQFINLNAFDIGRLRQLEAPWLGGLVTFLPHRESDLEVPVFVCETGIQMAGRTNEWIYKQMKGRPKPEADDKLMGYVRFFFTTVVGKLGAFHFAESVEDILWLPGTSEEVKRGFAEKLQPLRFVAPYKDGRQQLRGTVVFHDALFLTSFLVAEDWTAELADQELLIEDLPVFFGQRFDLLVRK